ncbi:hypothetical protein J4Q44_G00049760 [Coregonus suidteri]|uniref:SPRY-associated domain-containing protein n=1 Tax=Coregonus suidteri TaxID=861788 RepID=A0AAN8M9X1_9TELE
MGSIASLFRSHRRATPAAGPVNNNTGGVNPLREIDISSIQAPEPRSREEFLQYACTLTLDMRTAHRRLSLSEGNTKATLQGAGQPYPDCPQRFDGWTQKRDIPVTYSPRLGVVPGPHRRHLAFYSVAESMAHLHTFRANFTQPQYAAFGVGSGVGVGLDFGLGQFSQTSDSIKICPM